MIRKVLGLSLLTIVSLLTFLPLSFADDTITFQPSSKDTLIMEFGENYGGEEWIGVENDARRSLVEFDISSIPARSKISSATLRLYYSFWATNNPVGRTYWVYRVTSHWTEGGATWDASFWSTPGGDYITSGGASQTVPSSANTWMQWDVTAIVSDWLEGGQPNYGFLIKDGDETGATHYFGYWSSREDPHSQLRPQLIISFAPASQRIGIYVKDIDGKPIEGASVTSTSQPSGQITLKGTTDSEGYVSFKDVKTGSFTFLASANGYVSNSESLSVSKGENIEKTILLEVKPRGIPGLPYESIIIGLLLGTFLLGLHKRR